MKIFLSWSGSRSREVALALRNWLPLILHYTQPWLSDKDIDAGERWSAEVGKELEGSNFGVICLTRENLVAEWILFEAGALSKALQTSSVCPYLLDVEFRDITGPLSQFQAKKAERDQTLQLLEAINAKSQTPVDAQRLRELFDALWPKLEEHLLAIPSVESSKPAQRSSADVMEELIQVVRTFDSRLTAFEQVMGREFRRQISTTVPLSEHSGIVPVKEQIRLTVTTEIDTPNMKIGKSRRIAGSRHNALKMIANVTGLNVDAVDLEWSLHDKESGEWVIVPEMKEFFDRPEAHVVVTDLPF